MQFTKSSPASSPGSMASGVLGRGVLTLPEVACRCFPVQSHEKILLNVNKGNEVPRRGWEGWVGGRTPFNATTVTVATEL